jgi:hypothetical protein
VILRRLIGTAVAVSAVTGLQLSPAGAASLVSGNSAAIAFYRAVVDATQHQGGVDEVQTGFVVMKDTLGKDVASVSLAMGSGKLPTGYVQVTEHLTVADSSGKISWASDALTPVCAGLCPDIPYQLLLTSAGLFGHFGSSAASGTCWAHDSGSLDYLKVGTPFGYDLVGNFGPLKRSKGSVVVTSTYPWGSKDSATEVDTVPANTHLPVTGLVHVAATVGQAAFQYRWTNKWLPSSPVEPKILLCKITK